MIQLFNKNVIIDDFVSSNYGLLLLSFDYDGESEDDFALGGSIETVFLGNSRISTLTSAKYQQYLTPRLTLVRQNGSYIETPLLREVVSKLSGKNRWSWLQVYDNSYGETLNYRCVITEISCKKINGKIAGIIIDFQCDSMYAYTKKYQYKRALTNANNTITLINSSDELNDYLYPKVTITTDDSSEMFTVKNGSDNNYTTRIENVVAGETIELNGSLSEIASTNTNNILDRFNFHFIRLVPGKNTLTFSSPCTVTLEYRLLRKVGI